MSLIKKNKKDQYKISFNYHLLVKQSVVRPGLVIIKAQKEAAPPY